MKRFFLDKYQLSSLKQISLFSGGGMIAQSIMMVYAIIVARALGPEKLGVYSGLYAILGLSITAVNFGLDQWMLKEAHNFESTRLIVSKIIRIKLILSFIWAVMCIVLLPLSNPEHFIIFFVVAGVGDVFFDILFNTIVTAWTIERKIKLLNFMLITSRAGKIILLIGLVLLNIVSPLSIALSRLLVSFSILIVSLIILKPIVSMDKPRELLSIGKSSIVFGFSDILAMIYGNIDVAILTYFSISDTGLYTPASGIIHALFIIPNSIFIYLLPSYAKKFDSVSNKKNKKKYFQILVGFFIIGIIISAILFFSSELAIRIIFGDEFSTTSIVLRILSPIMVFKSMSFGLATIIISTGNQRKRLFPQFIVCLMNIALNLVVIPQFGLLGVAWVYTFSELVLMIGYALIVIKGLHE